MNCATCLPTIDKAESKPATVQQAQSNCVKPSMDFETHIVPIIADIDAGFGNEEATYLLAKKDD